MSSKYNRVRVDDLLNKDSYNNQGAVFKEHKYPQARLCTIDRCNRKFVSEGALLAHQRRSHALPTLHVCTNCDSSFSSLPNLNKHVRNIIVQTLMIFLEPRRYSLNSLHIDALVVWPVMCSYDILTEALIWKIRSVHQKVKPYHCVACRVSFAFKDGLTRHNQMVHDQLRPFSCCFCPLKFKTKAHLAKHSLSIHPDKHEVVDLSSSDGKERS